MHHDDPNTTLNLDRDLSEIENLPRTQCDDAYVALANRFLSDTVKRQSNRIMGQRDPEIPAEPPTEIPDERPTEIPLETPDENTPTTPIEIPADRPMEIPDNPSDDYVHSTRS